MLALPLYHVAGLGILFRCLLAGATMVLAEEDGLRETIDGYAVTHLSLVATQLYRVLGEDDSVPASLKAVLLGGSAISPALVQHAHEAGWPIHTSYGSTEMATQITATPPDATLDALLSAGSPLLHREVQMDDAGVIRVRGATRCLGYLTASGLEKPFDAEGWLVTGDRGRWDAAGRLVVLGRTDHMFISGGENIHPEEIEKALLQLPGVRQALVAPVPDLEFGHRPVALVDAPEELNWEEALTGRLPRFMQPLAYFPWPEEATQEGGIKPPRKALVALVQGLWAAS